MSRFPPCAVLSNSNGGQVMPALSAVEYKGGQAQKDKKGGGMSSFCFELWDKGLEILGCLTARRAHDWIVY